MANKKNQPSTYWWDAQLDEIERTCQYGFKFVRPRSDLDSNGHGRAFDPENLE